MTDAWNDEELFAALKQALQSRRAVPPEFVAAGKSAFAWRNIDGELAQLTYDSSHSLEPVTVTRSDPASIRALTFTSLRLTIELEVTEESLLGQVVPAQAATITLQTQASAETVIASDEIGCFSVQPLPRGPFRLRCQASAGADVLTSWVTL
jgi:hypothetical protein